jgi:hypothetical protein
VEITADGQSVAVELAYWNGELFVNGDQFTSITGGWNGSGWAVEGDPIGVSGPTSISSTGITITTTREDVPFGMFSGKEIDLSKYTKLVVTVGSSVANFWLIVNNKKKISKDFSEYPVVAHTSLSKGTKTLNISGINSGYIAAYLWTTGGNVTAKITDMHLE